MYKLVNYFIKYNNNLEQTKDFFFSLESPNKGIIDFNYEQQKNSLIKPCLHDGLLVTQNIAIYEKDEEVNDIFANGVRNSYLK